MTLDKKGLQEALAQYHAWNEAEFVADYQRIQTQIADAQAKLTGE